MSAYPDQDRGDDGRTVWHPPTGPVTDKDWALKQRYDAARSGGHDPAVWAWLVGSGDRSGAADRPAHWSPDTTGNRSGRSR